MIKRSKNGVPVAKLSTSNQTVTKFKSKCSEIWSFIKQVWYVPFIWSLAWFTYWIVQENVILGNPITQGSYLNYIGFTISTIAIVVKGWISKKSNMENVEKKGKIGIKDNSTEFHETLSDEPFKESQYMEFEQSKPQPEHYSSIDDYQSQQPTETHLESIMDPMSPSEFSPSKVAGFNQNSHQEIPSDCLICPNLANCDQRQKRSSDPGEPCPFASAKPKKPS